MFAVNVLGPSLLAAAALPCLVNTKGTIINVSSTFGHRLRLVRTCRSASAGE